MATIHDVALAAGVSKTTVSRYLNNRIDLPSSTARRIDAAIAALQYRPNLLAKRLSTGRTEAISLVTPEIGNPFFAELAAAVEDAAEQRGYAVFMSSTRGDRAREAAALQRLNDRHVDGLILMTSQPDDGTLARLIEGHDNVVLLDEDIPGATVPRVVVENAHGAYLATRHLIAAGHRAIAHVSGPEQLFSVRERYAGFARAMAEAGLPVRPGHVVCGAYSRDFGRQAVRRLLDAPERPTAVFAASDYVAIGVMEGLKAAGLVVPADMSLVGFDDMPFAEMIEPGLTTIRQPVAELGRTALHALLALLDKQAPPSLTRLSVSLVERQSVAPPRQ